MNLQVYLYGQPVLRKVAEEIEESHPDFKQLVENMFETMYKSEGVGLAAPQIGHSIRLVVIDGSVMAEDFPECKDFKRVFVNPTIEEFSGEKISMDEGCLSLPGIHEAVSRHTIVKVKYQDENFNEMEETFTGFAARIVQHEFDHLEGKVFIDHISPIRKQLIKAKISNILKGNVRCHYLTKKQGK